MKPTREKVIERRDLVRFFLSEGMSYQDISELMQLGFVETVAYDLDLILSDNGDEISNAIEEMIADNPKSLQDYMGGKKAALGSLIGIIKKKYVHFDSKELQKKLAERLSQ